MEILTSSQLYNEVLNNGGFTINPRTAKLVDRIGYAIAIKGHQQVFDSVKFSRMSIAEYLNNNIDTFYSNGDLYIGAWWNSRDQKIYMDLVEVVDSKTLAIRKGMEGDQKSIYDLAKYETIWLPERQKTGTYTQQDAYIRLKIRQMCP